VACGHWPEAYGERMSQKDSLPIPAAASRDPRSLEILRVWIANGEQHVALSFGMWEDPAAWGLLLADLARHIAEAHAQQDDKIDAEDFLEQLRAGFESEMDAPTDEVNGTVQ
jgi:hypothetical protein